MKATFEEFSNKVLNDEFIARLLDAANGFLSLAKTDLGSFVTQILLLSGLGWGATSLLHASKLIPVAARQFKDFSAVISLVSSGAANLPTALKLAGDGVSVFSGAVGTALPWVLGISAAIAAIIAIAPTVKKWWQDLTGDVEFFTDKIQESSTQLEQNKARLEEISKLPWNERTEEILAEKNALMQENAELEKNLEYYKLRQAQEAAESLDEEVSITENVYRVYRELTPLNNSMAGSFRSIEEAIDAIYEKYGKTEEAFRVIQSIQIEEVSTDYSLDEIISEIQRYNQLIVENGQLTDEEALKYNAFIAAAQEKQTAYDVLGQKNEQLSNTLENTNKITEAYTNGIVLSEEAVNNLSEVIPNFSSALSNADGVIYTNVNSLKTLAAQSGYTEQEIYDLIAAQISANNTKMNFSTQLQALQNLAAQAGYTAEAMAAVFSLDPDYVLLQIRESAKWIAYQESQVNGRPISSEEAMARARQAYLDNLWASLKKYYQPVTSGNSGVTSGGGGATTTQKDPIEEQNKLFKEQIALLEDRLYFMQKAGATEEEQIEMLRDMQEEVYDQINWFKKKGYDEDSQYIRDLLKKWWEFEDEINSIFDGINDSLKEQIELEKELNELAKKRQIKTFVYKDGKFQYVSDVDALSETAIGMAELKSSNKFASGTLSAPGGISLVGEKGPELRIIGSGDGIIPHDITKNLWSWGVTTPSSMINAITNGIGTIGEQIGITIQNFNPYLPNVSNGQDFINYMKNNFWREAIQFAKTQ